MFKQTKPKVTLVTCVPLVLTEDLTHLSYTFYISNVSRALLTENSRHREASPSVKSSRYTLAELKKEEPFCTYEIIDDELQVVIGTEGHNRANNFLVLTGDDTTDTATISALEGVRRLIETGTPNDKAKYSLPDAYKTELTWTINGDSLKNFIKLRTDKAALWEIRNLAYEIYDQLPEDHKYLYEDSVYSE